MLVRILGRKAMNARKPIVRLALYTTLLALMWLPVACAKRSVTAPARNLNLAMGNPSNALAKPSSKDNYLIAGKYFVLSYNSTKGTSNWVSWRLSKSDIGTAARVSFYPNTSLPAGFRVVTPSDYASSGFDRGHMCPHADRSANAAMSRATFVMTNVVPQSPPLNEQTWERLESYCRDLALHGKVLYIITGPYGKGGVGKNGPANSIGPTGTIIVPSRCWKVIMVVNAGSGDDIAKVNRRTRLIAVVMPNTMKVEKSWSKYRTSVAHVEQLTGYKFFDKVPAQIIGPLKQAVDKTSIPRAAPRRYGRGSGD